MLTAMRFKPKNNSKPGLALIINNEKFNYKNLSERKGSTRDVERLVKAFRSQNLEVPPELQLIDGTLLEIKSLMSKVSLMDLTDFACIVVVIMAHGTNGNTIYAKDGEYCLDDTIWAPILRNRTLKDKGKFVIVEACRGSGNYFKSIPPSGDPADPKPTIWDEIKAAGNQNQMLHLNSCEEGYVAFINPDDGAPFIKAFCDIMGKFENGTKPFKSICEAVIEKVKTECGLHRPTLQTNLSTRFVIGQLVHIKLLRTDETPIISWTRIEYLFLNFSILIFITIDQWNDMCLICFIVNH